MRAAGAVRLILSALAALGFAGPVAAEPQLFGLNVEGDVEAGFRGFAEQPSSQRRAKFEEYRDFPAERPFLDQLRLRFFKPDESYSSEFTGSKWGQQDQEFSLTTGRLGLWQFGFSWDQTPHVFSTTGRMLATEGPRGVFTLPTPRPTSLTVYNDAPRLDEISLRWDTARIFLTLTPTPDLDFKAEYTRINKDGDRPMGMAFGSPGNNFLEILEPIEQTIHDFRLRATIAREQWQLQFGYNLSIFQNSLSRVSADNPCFANAVACGAGDGGVAAPATGQTSLAPDNMAHTLSLAGGVNLPMRSRVNANVSYSLRYQNDDFLPHTINPTISSPLLALPQSSLNGFVKVFLLNLNATSRPFRPLTLTAKYRLYDYDDASDEPLFPAHVVNDRTLVIEDRQTVRFGYTKQNADLDARWRFAEPLAVTLGGGWERWDRNRHREVQTSDEAFAKAAFDVTPFDWLLAKLTYRPSFRRTSLYDSTAHKVHTAPEATPPDIQQGQSPLLRKFDEGQRNRQQLDLLLQLMPTDAFTTTLTGGWKQDDYFSSPLGLQEATTTSAGIDFNWTPVERISFFAGYVYELIDQLQRSRSRPVTGTTTFDFPDFDWISNNVDTVHTIHAGMNATLIPNRLDWTVSGNYSTALGRIETRNPVAPTSGTAAQQLTAQAKPMPAFEDTLFRLETALRYRFWKNWTASFRYAFESFEKTDWRTDTLNPFMPGVTSIWLGNDQKNYTAHIVAFTVGYRFK